MAVLHSPQRLLVSQYWSDDQRISAAFYISRSVQVYLDRKKLDKLRRREYRRNKAVEELIEMHKRCAI